MKMPDEVRALAYLAALCYTLYFLFHGEPDVWDALGKSAGSTQKQRTGGRE